MLVSTTGPGEICPIATPSRNSPGLSQPSSTTCCCRSGMITSPPPNTSRPVLKNTLNSPVIRPVPTLPAPADRPRGSGSSSAAPFGRSSGVVISRARPASSSSRPAGSGRSPRVLSRTPSITRAAVRICHRSVRRRISFQAKAQMIAATTGWMVCSAVVKLGRACPLRQSSLSSSTINIPGSRKQVPLTSPPIQPWRSHPR